MQIGVVGLGRMGGNIVRRLLRDGHHCVVFDANPEAARVLKREGAKPARFLIEMISLLTESQRVIWLMLPAGQITEDAVQGLGKMLKPGDILIDGGNSYYKDDIRRANELAKHGVNYVDVGTSGGVWGLERGYCMMIGGTKEAVEYLDPIFNTLAPGIGYIPRIPGRSEEEIRAERGYIHAGPAGAGHFVKMIHNGIEYGMMQAYAEGFDILKNKNSKSLKPEERYDLNIADIAEVWRHGSVISSWLLDLTASALVQNSELDNFSGVVEDSGEGRWTMEAAIEEAVPVHVLSAALFNRFRSRQQHTFAEKLLSAMRFGFGGHKELSAPSNALDQPSETHGGTEHP
jgi:6-phosphogluconate dehydrogenase